MASLTRSGGPIIRRAQYASKLLPRSHKRLLHGTAHRRSVSEDRSQPLSRRLASAWNDTPTKWYPLSFGAGALLLLGMWLKKSDVFSSQDSALVQTDSEGREVAHLKGRWQVHVLGALPLRNMSRLWGYLNSLELPVWFRPFGFKLYAAIFGCNLDEMKEPDLTTYKSLGDFFYRELKDGVRPVANTALVSPADGTVLHFGQITDFRVEQVKGLTYSLDALLGADPPAPPPNTPTSSGTSTPIEADRPHKDMDRVAHQEFANVNGIEYSLDQLLGSGHKKTPTLDESSSSEEASASKSWWSWRPWRRSSSAPAPTQPATEHSHAGDVSVQTETKNMPDALAHDAGVAASMGLTPSLTRRRSWSGAHGLKSVSSPDSALYFCVVYLAPGDYHRFHSPAPWVVERRRHFVGELFSVSPYVARRLENLFVLNERVALLGRWKYGFFGMVPVGATNVGSIRVNFDEQLRTNVKGVRPPPGTYTEATYEAASTLLGGQPLAQAEEMGGFRLGSTVVLVFEAPRAWDWKIEAGQKVKVGQALGDVKST